MKSMQRQFGKLGKRSSNDADVQTVLDEFKAVDSMLDLMLRELKAWRNGWEDMLRYQYNASEAFATLYKPIEPTSDAEMRHQPAETPAKYMQKCLGLQKENSDLKTDLAQELVMIDNKLIRPVEAAKINTKVLHKTIKYRENTKLDYERYQGRADHLRSKDLRSAKDEQALSVHENNLAQARIDYQTADEQVKQTFPPVTDAVLSLLPLILANMIMLQTEMVGQLYTIADAYTNTYGISNPAPSNQEILSTFDHEFTILRKELETGLKTIARGKVVNMTMNLPAERDKTTLTGLGLRNKVLHREKSDQALAVRPARLQNQPSFDRESDYSAQEEIAPPKPPRPGMEPSNGSYKTRVPSSGNLGVPSNGSYGAKTPPFQATTPSPRMLPYPDSSGLTNLTPPSRYLTPTGTSPHPSSNTAGAGGEYFGNRRPSATSQVSLASSVASVAAAKKKPPPPPPAKKPNNLQQQFVIALYDFEGQNPGDLAFNEGDRIRVVKKTGSTDDWWEGELRGRSGAFPANYVKV